MLQLQADKSKEKKNGVVLTQREAARILGVTHWYLNRVLRGRLSSLRLTKRYRELVDNFTKNAAEVGE